MQDVIRDEESRPPGQRDPGRAYQLMTRILNRRRNRP
jgi:hypothetical protein